MLDIPSAVLIHRSDGSTLSLDKASLLQHPTIDEALHDGEVGYYKFCTTGTRSNEEPLLSCYFDSPCKPCPSSFLPLLIFTLFE